MTGSTGTERERRLNSPAAIYYAHRTSDGMIKIGYTTASVRYKLKELSKKFGPLQLLLTHGGWNDEKRALHEKFAACRIPGTEWFEPSLPLLRWICKTRQDPRYRRTHPDYLPLKQVEKMIAPGGITPPESHYRDLLAKQVGGRTEVTLPFGRCDVLTDTTVYEVEPAARWGQGVAQALQYAAQVPQRGAVALYGKGPTVETVRRRLDSLPYPGLELWWLQGGSFVRIGCPGRP